MTTTNADFGLVQVPLRGTKAFAVLDQEVWESGLLRNGDWRLSAKTRYRARAYTPNDPAKYPVFPRRLYLERLITGAPLGKYVRFKNSNTLDCRRANLDVVDQRSDVARHDVERRKEWMLDEQARYPSIIPERRRVDAWRLVCLGYTFEEISRELGCTMSDAGGDVVAVLGDPLAIGFEGRVVI